MQNYHAVSAQVFLACPVLKHMVDEADIVPASSRPVCVGEALTEIIVSQMLSHCDAEKILKCMRRKAGHGKMWRLSQEALFTCGVSRSKARTIHLMGKHYDGDTRGFESWRSESEAVVRDEIKRLWGMGDWTVDRLLINYFGHGDVWPQHDLAITHALEKLYRVSLHLGEDWRFDPDQARPYRSTLVKLLWRIDEIHPLQLEAIFQAHQDDVNAVIMGRA